MTTKFLFLARVVIQQPYGRAQVERDTRNGQGVFIVRQSYIQSGFATNANKDFGTNYIHVL